MKLEKTAAYSASFRNQELRIWESKGCWPWSVTNPETGEVIAQGEAVDRDSAMVRASQAAEADWGSVRWRRFKEDDQNEEGIEPA
jgi:hypothetical protein